MILDAAKRALRRTVSHQLGDPNGLLGEVVARFLNKGNSPTITAAVAALALSGDEEVADIGFGGGLGLDLLLEATRGTVHGVEPSADMVRRAQLADGALDAWITLNTFYFVDDLEGAAAELTRVLAPGGTGVVGIADPDWLAANPFTQHGFTVRPVEEVVRYLVAAGLAVDVRQVTDWPTTAGEAPYNLLVCAR